MQKGLECASCRRLSEMLKILKWKRGFTLVGSDRTRLNECNATNIAVLMECVPWIYCKIGWKGV
jgi:hypothetical protein